MDSEFTLYMIMAGGSRRMFQVRVVKNTEQLPAPDHGERTFHHVDPVLRHIVEKEFALDVEHILRRCVLHPETDNDVDLRVHGVVEVPVELQPPPDVTANTGTADDALFVTTE